MNETLQGISSRSVEETREIGRRIGAALRGGEVIALIGGLGAGKTQLVKGIATGAGIRDAGVVNSPTFVLVNEYTGRVRVIHIDAYRLSGAAELIAIGIEEMFASEPAVVVEWADRVSEILPPDRLSIHFTIEGEHQRRLELVATGVASLRLLTAARGAAG